MERLDTRSTLDLIDGVMPWCSYSAQKDLQKARDAVVALIEAATRANGEHSAPHDCYATGPLTGDRFRDLVSCPGCELAAALSRATEGEAK